MSLTEAINLAAERGERYATGAEGWNWWRARRAGNGIRYEFWPTWWVAPAWETYALHPTGRVDWVLGELDVTRPPWER